MISDTVAAIDRLKDLQPNWDSYGAPRVEDATRKSAKELLHNLVSSLGQAYADPIVGPDVDGGVELIWGAQSTEVHARILPHKYVTNVLALADGTRVLERMDVKTAEDLIPFLAKYVHL